MCAKVFTWREKKYGQEFCSSACSRSVGNAGGRPTVMTPEVIVKLEEVFALGGTDGEATFWANISMAALYDYQLLHPEFRDRKEALKRTPILKARQTIVTSLDRPETAQWFLERKMKDEFSTKQIHEDVTPAREIDFDAQGQKSLDSVTPKKKL